MKLSDKEFQEILTQIQVTEELIGIIQNYKKDKKLHEKELIAYIIKATGSNPDMIKLLSNDYSNANVLKQYFGDEKTFPTIFNTNINGEKYEMYTNVYMEILLSKETTIGYKRVMIESFNKLKINSTQEEFFIQKLKSSINELTRYPFTIKDTNWFIDSYSFQSKKDFFFNVKKFIDIIQEPSFDIEKNINACKAIRVIIVAEMKSLNATYNQPNMETFDILFPNKEEFTYWYETLKWFVDKVNDNKSNSFNREKEFGVQELSSLIAYIKPSQEYFPPEELLKLLIPTFKDEKEFESFCLKTRERSYRTDSGDIFNELVKNNSLFKNTVYEDIANKVLFEKAENQIHYFQQVQEGLKTIPLEEKILFFQKRLNKSYSFLDRGTNADFTSLHFYKNLDEFVSAHTEKSYDYLKRLTLSNLDMRMFRAINNEGNMTGDTLLKHLFVHSLHPQAKAKQYTNYDLLSYIIKDNLLSQISDTMRRATFIQNLTAQAMDIYTSKDPKDASYKHLVSKELLDSYVKEYLKHYSTFDLYVLINKSNDNNSRFTNKVETNADMIATLQKEYVFNDKFKSNIGDFYDFNDKSTHLINLIQILKNEIKIDSNDLFDITVNANVNNDEKLNTFLAHLANDKNPKQIFYIVKTYLKDILDIPEKYKLSLMVNVLIKSENEEYSTFLKTIKTSEKNTLLLAKLISNAENSMKEKDPQLLALKENVIDISKTKEIQAFLKEELGSLFNLETKKEKKVVTPKKDEVIVDDIGH